MCSMHREGSNLVHDVLVFTFVPLVNQMPTGSKEHNTHILLEMAMCSSPSHTLAKPTKAARASRSHQIAAGSRSSCGLTYHAAMAAPKASERICASPESREPPAFPTRSRASPELPTMKN